MTINLNAAPKPALTLPTAPATNGATPGAPAQAAPNARRHPIPNVLVLGESGSGKTRSLRNLPWASGRVAFIDTEMKGFDWIRSIPEECYFDGTDPMKLLEIMTRCEQNPNFDIIVIDSFTGYSIAAHEAMKRTKSGYDIYSSYNSRIVEFLKRCSSKTKRYVVTAIPEVLLTDSGGNTTGVSIKRAAVHGREMEGKVESFFAYAVFMKLLVQPNARPHHLFALAPDAVSQAKIPEGVTDKLTMPNDVNELLKMATEAESKY